MSFISHLECAKCGETFDMMEVNNLCRCGFPLLARYDLDSAAGIFTRDRLSNRPPTLWRYKELLPVVYEENIISLGEGLTPVLRAQRLGAVLGMKGLFLKDEGLCPTGTFKARGASVGISKARELGVKAISMPTAGNAGGAWSCYAARAGIRAYIAMPKDAPEVAVKECIEVGARVFLVDGLITDAGRFINKGIDKFGWYDASTLKEPYRIEGKKTMGFEVAEQFLWQLPDAIVYPCGGGVGLIGMWKAFAELKALNLISKVPKLIAVQATGCSPIVKAFEEGRSEAEFWQGASTLAGGLRIPKPLGDFLILKAIKETDGYAIAVTDQEILDAKDLIGQTEGMVVCPEGAAAVAAVSKLLAVNVISRDDEVVVFNTGSGLKYTDIIQTDIPVYDPDEEEWLQALEK